MNCASNHFSSMEWRTFFFVAFMAFFQFVEAGETLHAVEANEVVFVADPVDAGMGHANSAPIRVKNPDPPVGVRSTGQPSTEAVIFVHFSTPCAGRPEKVQQSKQRVRK